MLGNAASMAAANWSRIDRARSKVSRSLLGPFAIRADQAGFNPAVKGSIQNFIRNLVRCFAVRHYVDGLRNDAVCPINFGAGEFVRCHCSFLLG